MNFTYSTQDHLCSRGLVMSYGSLGSYGDAQSASFPWRNIQLRGEGFRLVVHLTSLIRRARQLIQSSCNCLLRTRLRLLTDEDINPALPQNVLDIEIMSVSGFMLLLRA